MLTDTTKKRPTHRVYCITESHGKAFWQPIGAGWAHADQKGVGIKLEYLPLMPGAQLAIRLIEETETTAETSAAAPVEA